MAANTLKEFLPILGFVLALVIVSMMVLSYFNINMNETGGLRTLNRFAIHEGMTNGMESFVEGNDVGVSSSLMEEQEKEDEEK